MKNTINYLEVLEELEAIRAYDNAISAEDEEISFEQVISEIEENQ